MIRIELPHSFYLFTALDGSPIEFLLVPYVAILSRPLFILVLPPILFRQFQKFSKLLYPLSLHLSSIQGFTIRLEPIHVVMLFKAMFRRIPMIFFKEINHILIFIYPFLILCHTHKYYFTFDADTLLSQASIRIILGAFSIPKSFIVFKTVLRSPSVKYSITFKLWLVSLARSYTPT